MNLTSGRALNSTNNNQQRSVTSSDMWRLRKTFTYLLINNVTAAAAAAAPATIFSFSLKERSHYSRIRSYM